MEFEDEESIKREQSDDLLFEAYDEPIKTKAIKLAKQALELNPNNIDAENFITKHETNTIKRLKKYEETLNKEKANLEKENFFNKENVGIFWGLIETRPYMRTKHKIFSGKDLGKGKGGISYLTKNAVSRIDLTRNAFIMALNKTY